MADYIKKASETKFVDLAEDIEFKKDLVRFFTGGRYKYSREEMEERGFEALTKDFVEHMRGQSWNEVTAIRDLNYVRNKDMSQSGKDAFGRLIQAWDSSEEVGSTFGESVLDFTEALVTAPSTYVGIGSFGLGKAASKAAGKATQIAVRLSLKEAAKKNLTKAATQRTISQVALREGAIGFGTGAGIGGVQAYGAGETREEVEATGEYTGKDLAYDAIVGGVVEGTLGGALGTLSGVIGRGRAKKVDDVLQERSAAFKKEAEQAAELAKKTIDDATEDQKSAAMGVVSDIEEILSARKGNSKSSIKNPLDPERVAKGKAILSAMADTKANPEFTSGLSAQTLRGIAAAAVDLQKELNVSLEGGSLRITQAVADMMRDGKGAEAFTILDKVKKAYGLSKDEMSLIYMADVSRAGQTLGFASAISRGAKIDMMKESDIDVLFSKGASSINGQDAKEITAAAIRNQKVEGKLNKLGDTSYKFLQDIDALRVSLMTSQPTTTMRNVASTGILIGADMSDQVFRSIFKGLRGDTTAIRNIVPDMTAILRGMSMNKTEGMLLKQIMLDELPEQSARLYNDAMRLELGTESNSKIAKIGRAVNFANTLTDTVLKESIFYGSMDRQFRQQGLSLTDWLRSNTKLDDLPEGISVEKATKQANSITMQDTFRDNQSVVGKTTRALVNANRKIPFLISTAAGVPFPRYLGNHLQTMSQYTPGVAEIFNVMNIIEGDEEVATRLAKQATGALMLWGGYELADQRQGEVDYASIKNTLLQEAGRDSDLQPLLGATVVHMYVGDILWRKENGLPVTDVSKDLLEVAGGIPEFSFDIEVFEELLNKDISSTEALSKKAADFLATYSMNPLTALSRDIIGQLSYDQAGTPFTRDLAEGEGVSMKGEEFTLDEFKNRSTRFLPDLLFTQYSQSLNGKTDIPYYDFDNPVARGKIDPITKQITGVAANPPKTELQKEMSRYGLKNYQLYTASGIPNPVIDNVLRTYLARTMHKQFEKFKEESVFVSEQYPRGTKWEDIPDNKDKGLILEKWITNKIGEGKKKVEDRFDRMVTEDPIEARGFIRNQYLVYAKSKRGEGARNLDKAANAISGMTAAEYLNEAETMQDEVERRIKLLGEVELLPPL